MKKVMLTAILAIAWAMPARAQDTHEKFAEDAVKAMGNFADVLTTVKDKASHDAAKPKLKEAGQKLGELKARGDKLGDPPADQKADLEKKFKPKMEEVTKKLQTEMIRISQLDGGMDILKDITQYFGDLGKKK